MLLEISSWLCEQEIAIVLQTHVYKVLISLSDQIASLWAGLKDCQVMTSVFSMRRTRFIIPDQQVFFITTVLLLYFLCIFIRTGIAVLERVLEEVLHTVLQGYFRNRTL